MKREEVNKGIIYKATNVLNGKVYVGQTWMSLERRRGYHHRGTKCLYFDRAIKKYGRENFKWEVLASADTQKELDSLEKHHIEDCGSLDPAIGYNIREGGSYGKHSQRTKIKVSRSKGGKSFFAMKGLKVLKFDLLKDAEDCLGVSSKSIYNILTERGKKTSKGWYFSYDSEYKNPCEFYVERDGECLIFQDQSKAAEVLDINRRTLSWYLSKGLIEKDGVKISRTLPPLWQRVYEQEDQRKK